MIEWVRLRDIKSHVDTEVRFAGGVNGIAGKTGAGKSTVLEAIGYALFDYLPYSSGDFVREGEKTGSVFVGIRSRIDGKPYTVSRTCGSRSEWAVYDPSKDEPEDKIVSGKEDVADRLREHLKVGLDGPSAIPLSVLFQESIGVPEDLFTAPFLQSPAQRKRVFAPLLGMEDCDKAYENLREPEAYLKNARVDLEKEEAGLIPPDRTASSPSGGASHPEGKEGGSFRRGNEVVRFQGTARSARMQRSRASSILETEGVVNLPFGLCEVKASREPMPRRGRFEGCRNPIHTLTPFPFVARNEPWERISGSCRKRRPNQVGKVHPALTAPPMAAAGGAVDSRVAECLRRAGS